MRFDVDDEAIFFNKVKITNKSRKRNMSISLIGATSLGKILPKNFIYFDIHTLYILYHFSV